jgi:hypothetical protein
MTSPRFISDETLFLSPCASCARKHADAATCDAFPKRIPAAILNGQHDHRTPYPGDHGLQYLAAPERPLSTVADEKGA